MTKNLLCVCNPLLDISNTVTPQFLEKYKIAPSSAALADPELHGPSFFQELSEQKGTEHIAGGSGMNTARVCSWMLEENNKVHYMGAVGKDHYATTLKDNATQSGVDVSPMMEITDETPTGLCAVCITGKERSLVASLQAANKFAYEHIKSDAVQKCVKDASIVYASGFFLTVCPEALCDLAEKCKARNLTFGMNMSAPFIMQYFKDPLMKLLPYCDIIFCNEDEARSLAQMLGIGEGNLEPNEIASQIASNQILKANGLQTVVFTQGKDPVVLSCSNSPTELVEVPTVPFEEIVDTNGAGDAFVGGFLSGLCRGIPLKKCVELGSYAAGIVIRQSGCQTPGKPSPP